MPISLSQYSAYSPSFRFTLAPVPAEFVEGPAAVSTVAPVRPANYIFVESHQYVRCASRRGRSARDRAASNAARALARKPSFRNVTTPNAPNK